MFHESARFTTAIEAARAAGLDSILNMALVGRARARLNLGDLEGAAADARQVPEGFVKNANYSIASSRSGNHIYRWVNRFSWASVGPAYRDVEFRGVPDPRVVVVNTGETGADAFSIVWEQTKYPTEDTPIPIATWEEAQLIIAEAELAAGNPQAAVDVINTLHERAGLPPFNSSDPEEIMDHLIQERSRELFLEGHHVYDIIRYDIPLTPPPGADYPIKGGFYGSTTCLPLPEIERVNNPNIGG